MMNIQEQKIEALLFYRNEPVRFEWIAKQLNLNVDEVIELLSLMLGKYEVRGMELVLGEESASLVVKPELTQGIPIFSKQDSEKELSKQALETLAIIAYQKKITKAELDYIRGVNSMFILRNLLMRGLIEKIPNPNDKRSPFYLITHETLVFLGIQNTNMLPDYQFVQNRLEKACLEHQSEQESVELKESNEEKHES